MRKSVKGLSVFAVLVLLLTAVAFGQAQDATEEPTQEMTTEPMPEATMEATSEPMAEATMEATADMSMSGTSGTTGSVVCSSDLLVNLYIAERYFGFGGMNDEWMQSGASTLDLTQFDKGQFAPWFDSMMDMPSGMSSEQNAAITDMMLMDDATMQQDMMANMPDATMLAPATFADDSAECAMLRTTLNRFFLAVASQGSVSMMGVGASPEATTEAGTSTDTTSGSMVNANFSTTLSGTAEIPGPGDEDATGTAAITIDFSNSQICYNVTVQNVTLPAAAMHIHMGNADESGPVVVPFDKAPDESGNATGCVAVSDMDVLNQIATSPAGFYVNVHTSDFPDGAVRGQVAG